MIWFWVAIVLQLVVGFFYLLSGLLAPLWAVGVLVAAWIALSVLLIRTRSQGPRDLWAPVLAAALWLGAMAAGEHLLGWNA
ncbi:MAG TPA: hypothetical protein VIG64_05895 [Actinomycetota bacterium]